MENSDAPSVCIYLKGHAHPNPGKAAYVAMLECNGNLHRVFGIEKQATSNAVEIMGATEAFKALKRPCAITLYSNCLYLVNEATKFLADGQIPFANRGLWLQLALAARPHTISFMHVRKAENSEYMRQVDEEAWRKVTD